MNFLSFSCNYSVEYCFIFKNKCVKFKVCTFAIINHRNFNLIQIDL